MELQGVVHNGVIVPDDATALPEGTRVRIIVAPVPSLDRATGSVLSVFFVTLWFAHSTNHRVTEGTEKTRWHQRTIRFGSSPEFVGESR
jgi:hypothetical protein